MKYALVLIAFLLSNIVNAQVTTQCSSSAADADGDGYGWENNASCVVGNTTNSTPQDTTSDCIDSPPLGNGWGWNGTESCRIEVAQPTTPPPTTPASPTRPICQFPGVSDPDGDGFGYENGDSCRVVDSVSNTQSQQSGIGAMLKGGTWSCTLRYPHIDANIQYNGEPHFPTITSWQFNPQVVCGSRCAGNYAGTKTLTFSDTQVAIETITTNGHWQGVETVPWSVNEMQMILGNDALQKFAFENYEGREYFHYYLDDSSRWTCQRQ